MTSKEDHRLSMFDGAEEDILTKRGVGTGEKCILRNFTICTPCQIVFR
jgi:hypothetical protein